MSRLLLVFCCTKKLVFFGLYLDINLHICEVFCSLSKKLIFADFFHRLKSRCAFRQRSHSLIFGILVELALKIKLDKVKIFR